LEYFKHAVQLGMTATPKRQDNVDTYRYFSDPVYEYSLKEGINDGFLTPYKVKRIQTNIDELVIDHDVHIVDGEAEKDLYEIKDFDRSIVIPERTELISQEILKQINIHDKTIIFCVDQEHAARVRDAINNHKTIRDADYCVRVTSNEGQIGRTYLERFQDNDKTIPTILTSSQMLTTGVDAKNVRNIVLLRTIGSMTEFKQIIGRGTRIFEGKDYFTIMDFTGATNLFYDPAWDGEQIQESPEHSENQEKSDTDDVQDIQERMTEEENIDTEPKKKLRVKLANNRELRIINIETRYISDDGKPLSATEYLESLIGKLPALYHSEEQLRQLRADPKTREDLLVRLTDI
jgi:type I restriction enzyme R subunit